MPISKNGMTKDSNNCTTGVLTGGTGLKADSIKKSKIMSTTSKKMRTKFSESDMVAITAKFLRNAAALMKQDSEFSVNIRLNRFAKSIVYDDAEWSLTLDVQKFNGATIMHTLQVVMPESNDQLTIEKLFSDARNEAGLEDVKPAEPTFADMTLDELI